MMYHDRLIILSTKTMLFCFVALIFVLIFGATISVFQLKVFTRSVNSALFFVTMGLFALMVASLLTNVVLNLNKMADHLAMRSVTSTHPTPPPKITRWLFGMGAGLFGMVGLLFVGHYLTVHKKESLMMKTAQAFAQHIEPNLNQNHWQTWDLTLVQNIGKQLLLANRQIDRENHLPNHHYLLVLDDIDGQPVILAFDENHVRWQDNSKIKDKINFVHAIPASGRVYLNEFIKNKGISNQNQQPFFTSHDGLYEIYYPLQLQNKKALLYFSDYQSYGKVGS